MVTVARFGSLFACLVGSAVDVRPHCFFWSSYNDDRGRAFVSPRWDVGVPGPNEGDFVTLRSAEGVIRLDPGWVLTAARLRVLCPSPETGPGVFRLPPVIDTEAKVGAYDPRARGWPVAATDPNPKAPARFPPGLKVHVQWSLTAIDPDGKTHGFLTDAYPAAENVRFRRRN